MSDTESDAPMAPLAPVGIPINTVKPPKKIKAKQVVKKAAVKAKRVRDAEDGVQQKEKARKKRREERIERKIADDVDQAIMQFDAEVKAAEQQQAPPQGISFGPLMQIQTHITVPFEDDHDQLAETIKVMLKANALVSVILHTIFHRVTNTTNGKMAIFPATLYIGNEVHKVFLGHWSLLRTIMAQFFTGFTRTPETSLKHIKKAFSHFVVNYDAMNDTDRLCMKRDINRMCFITGTKIMPLGRALKCSHFIMSATFVKHAARILRPFNSVHELLINPEKQTQAWCTDRSITIKTLKDFNETQQLSAYHLNPHAQGKLGGNEWMLVRPPKEPFTESTPAFGIEYWDTLLQQSWTPVRALVSGQDITFPAHMISMYEDSKNPVHTREEVLNLPMYKNGVPNDLHLVPKRPHNLAHKRLLKTEEDLLASVGMQRRSPGRPPKSQKPVVEKIKKLEKALAVAQNMKCIKQVNREKLSKIQIDASEVLQEIRQEVENDDLNDIYDEEKLLEAQAEIIRVAQQEK